MKDKFVWVRADTAQGRDERKAILTAALESDLLSIAVREEDIESFLRIGRFQIISVKDGSISVDGREGMMLRISGKDDETEASRLAGKADMVVVSVDDWKVIPMENLIAAFQGSGTDLVAQVSDPEEIPLFFGALEAGVDGILLEPASPEDVIRSRRILDELRAERVDLVQARVVEIRSLGQGDRVCIDTCSMLRTGEGMLIGSRSSGLFLVHSESIDSEYASARPFRVNAGSVQSYALAAGDRTPYLSDLRTGDELLAVDSKGNARSVIIGRLKIEKRPLVLVSAEHGGDIYNIILQNAETVRLVSGGKAVSLVELKKGDEVSLMVSEGGRHFGTKVKESIKEL
ncbi:MAG: 3-dehydroquinate synthase II [Candidatus Thermoplasmatota archaeon]|nr:3-dehydroquinate synthase II [Candidatus Thermoplasmatota archaeon]